MVCTQPDCDARKTPQNPTKEDLAANETFTTLISSWKLPMSMIPAHVSTPAMQYRLWIESNWIPELAT